MRALTRTIVAVSLLVVLTSRGDAQSLPSAAGHWEGAVQIPEMELAVEIDLKANGAVYAGTFSQPVQGVKGLPLSTVVVEGKNVRFVVRAGQAASNIPGALVRRRHIDVGSSGARRAERTVQADSEWRREDRPSTGQRPDCERARGLVERSDRSRGTLHAAGVEAGQSSQWRGDRHDHEP